MTLYQAEQSGEALPLDRRNRTPPISTGNGSWARFAAVG